VRRDAWGNVHTGGFAAGELHGAGVSVDAQGNRSEGTWSHGKLDGIVTRISRLGARTTAHYAQGTLDGDLDQTDDDHVHMVARAHQGWLEGPARIDYPDGRVATGSFSRGQFDGVWIVTEKNGSRAEVEYDHGTAKRGSIQLPRQVPLVST
jgi:hypothetical protein